MGRARCASPLVPRVYHGSTTQMRVTCIMCHVPRVCNPQTRKATSPLPMTQDVGGMDSRIANGASGEARSSCWTGCELARTRTRARIRERDDHVLNTGMSV